MNADDLGCAARIMEYLDEHGDMATVSEIASAVDYDEEIINTVVAELIVEEVLEADSIISLDHSSGSSYDSIRRRSSCS